ncbi:maleylpyruvate isomerase N-terminal domain-containing protein [Nocardioides sp. W7]|uniref:maleylpyruvate isomerase N-terminal domain-containing protein n=1 Tax=Nocardioides sp. W7 TaxID=2931390 RepID=UPI001FD03E14|nr:maleylpyruvate isomerase N-terminal domain-containing protein [Nocardioides sp. W7]
MAEPRDTFLEAAEAFADLVARLRVDLGGPGSPGLGDWDLRALVGHTSRSLVTVSTYLGRAADAVEVPSAAAYFLAVRELAAGPEVTERGRQAGEVLGADPAAVVRRLLETVADDLVAASEDQLLTTVAGGMRLRDYLPTRTFELVVHGSDIATATGLDWTPPADALAETVGLAGEIALASGAGLDLLRQLTGRGGEVRVL